ncbi:MAG TPA: CDP-glycerol glycerophosphotransferase family protein, partial [Gammaproteobacteria bacterium]
MKFLDHIAELVRFKQLPRDQRRVVFYSEGKAYWSHLRGMIEYWLGAYDVSLCYFSSDPQDPGLKLGHSRFQAFGTDSSWIRNWLFENVDTSLMVMTMPDLHQYQVKRSCHPVHYVYVHHSLVSMHMAYRPGAYDHFDTIFCAGPHHVLESREMENQRRSKKKNLVEHGYGRLDAIMQEYKQAQAPDYRRSGPVHVLLAPSWGTNGLIETMGKEVVDHLMGAGFKLTMRPHPHTVKAARRIIDRIAMEHGDNPGFVLELNVSGRDSLYQSDIMISDWSGAALEYAFGLNKPVVYVDTPKKINNPHYAELTPVPIEESIREKIGHIISPDSIPRLKDVIHAALAKPKSNAVSIHDHVFNVGQADKKGAEALYS